MIQQLLFDREKRSFLRFLQFQRPISDTHLEIFKINVKINFIKIVSAYFYLLTWSACFEVQQRENDNELYQLSPTRFPQNQLNLASRFRDEFTSVGLAAHVNASTMIYIPYARISCVARKKKRKNRKRGKHNVNEEEKVEKMWSG